MLYSDIWYYTISFLNKYTEKINLEDYRLKLLQFQEDEVTGFAFLPHVFLYC